MASIEQVELLISFMERNKELALGRCTRSKEGRSLAKRLWAECAGILNYNSLNCQNRSPERWRAFYNEYKSKLLSKIKKQKAELQATGGGPAANITLTPLQERLYNIIGRDVGEPLEGVRHNPLFGPQDNAGVGVHGIPFLVYNTQAQAVSFEAVPEQQNVPPLSEPASSASLADTVEPVISIVDSIVQDSNAEPIGTVEPTPPPYRVAIRRRRRRRRSLDGSQHRSVNEPTTHLEEAQRRLAEIESQRTAALDRMAVAIGQPLDRLAAAIGPPLDRLATALSQPIKIYIINSSSSPPLRKRARVIISSESDSD